MPTDTRTRQAPSTQARWAIPAAGAVVGGLLVALVVGGGAAPTSLEGIAGPGPLVSWGLPLLRAVATTEQPKKRITH